MVILHKWIQIGIAVAGTCFIAEAADVDLSKLPPVAEQKPDFVRDIYPENTELIPKKGHSNRAKRAQTSFRATVKKARSSIWSQDWSKMA